MGFCCGGYSRRSLLESPECEGKGDGDDECVNDIGRTDIEVGAEDGNVCNCCEKYGKGTSKCLGHCGCPKGRLLAFEILLRRDGEQDGMISGGADGVGFRGEIGGTGGNDALRVSR